MIPATKVSYVFDGKKTGETPKNLPWGILLLGKSRGSDPLFILSDYRRKATSDSVEKTRVMAFSLLYVGSSAYFLFFSTALGSSICDEADSRGAFSPSPF